MTHDPKIPLNILLADDDSDDRLFFTDALKKISLPTGLTMVNDGQRLMDYLANNITNLPDVIFLDLNMPCKNGDECLDEIKRNVNLQHIPVVICSTSRNEEISDKLHKTGAHYYLCKGELADLARSIEKVLGYLIKDNLQPARNNFMLKLEAFA